jgi:hypothetical protein
VAVWPSDEQPRTIVADITVGQVVSFQLPPGVALAVESVVATIDAAAGSTPELTIEAPGGAVITAKPQAVAIPAGATAFATWALRLDDDETATPAPTPGMCRLLGSGSASGNSLTVTLTGAVPAAGVLQLIFCGTSAHGTDTSWSATAVSDSQGVAGWVVSTATDPMIGYIRQTSVAPAPGRSTMAGSAIRPVTAGDLSAGDTITATFNSAFPADFHVVALAVWQQAYFVTITQGGIVEYGFGDSYPDIAISSSRLSWLDDYGVGMGAPASDALTITAMGASPGQTGFSPINGTLVGEISTADVSVACHCLGVPELTRPDPGGSWPAAATHLVGNYQTVKPRVFG